MDVGDDTVVEGTIIRSENFLALSDKPSHLKKDILFYTDNGIKCHIKLAGRRRMPNKFSAQYLEKLCSFKLKMLVEGIKFGETVFTAGIFRVQLTGDLVKFLSEHASHFEQLHGKYKAYTLLFWLARKGFAIYEGDVVGCDLEARARFGDWERIREEINEIRLPGDSEVL